MLISELEQIIEDIFDKKGGLVKSVDTVYEAIDNGYKLVISIHGLVTDESSVIHTKFIFKVDKEKRNVVEKYFHYLYDINCIYHKIDFDSSMELKNKIIQLLRDNEFGEDILILSDFNNASAVFLNHYMRLSNVTDYSIFDVEYEPKFKVTKCENIRFNFKININDNYFMDLSIKKEEEEDKKKVYKLKFDFMEESEIVETDTLTNIHFVIGSNIARILDKKLKNK
jgi:hypothetical protein